jgi:hypothetical protein
MKGLYDKKKKKKEMAEKIMLIWVSNEREKRWKHTQEGAQDTDGQSTSRIFLTVKN